MKYLYQLVTVQLLMTTAFADTDVPNCPPEGIRHNCFAEYISPSSGTYSGQWAMGNYEGFGTYIAPNGDRYAGQFKLNHYHGSGTYFFSNGERYVGEFKNGKKHGQGIIYSADGDELMDGFWDEDKYQSLAKKIKEPGKIALDWKDRIEREVFSFQQKQQSGLVWSDVISKVVALSLEEWLKDDTGLNFSEIPPPKLPPPISIVQDKWESDKEFADRLAGLEAKQQKEIEQIFENHRKLNEQRNKNLRIAYETKLAKLQILPQVSSEFIRLAISALVVNISFGEAEFDPKKVVLYLNLGIGGQAISKYEFTDASIELRKAAVTDLKSLWFYPDFFVNADGYFGLRGIKIASGDTSAYGMQVTSSADNQPSRQFSVDLSRYSVKKTFTSHQLQSQPLVQPEAPPFAQAASGVSEKVIDVDESLSSDKLKGHAEESKRLPDESNEISIRRLEQINKFKALGEASIFPIENSNPSNSFVPTGTYLSRLRARIRPNIFFPDSLLQTVKGNPEAEVVIFCRPDGKIISKRLTRSSGHRAWDEAVLNAIEKTGILPRDDNGNLPQKISFLFRPRD